MKSTLEVTVAVQNGDPLTDQELRYAVESLRSMLYFTENHLRKVTGAIGSCNDLKLSIYLRGATRFLESAVENKKKPMDEWLGPDNVPGSNAFKRRVALADRLVEKFLASTEVSE